MRENHRKGALLIGWGIIYKRAYYIYAVEIRLCQILMSSKKICFSSRNFFFSFCWKTSSEFYLCGSNRQFCILYLDTSLTPVVSGEWQGAALPLLTSATIKQEKPESGIVSRPSTSTPTRFTPTKAPKDFTGSKPAFAASGASRFPASEDEIVDMTISEFSSFLETLSDADAQKARDIRRRGKNKVAARLCRKRKIELVGDIESDIDTLRKKKEDIINERKKLQAENAYYRNKISELEDHLFQSLRDESGRPLSSKEYSLFQGANGSIYVGKNIDSESRGKKPSNKK